VIGWNYFWSMFKLARSSIIPPHAPRGMAELIRVRVPRNEYDVLDTMNASLTDSSESFL
jgi:hypothetical protein